MAKELCVVSDGRIKESSGIALSRRQPDAVWIHNDSGDAARLFLVGLDGKTRGVVRLRGDWPVDWEDMCAFVASGTSWLLVGDIGDNARNRSLATSKGRSKACRLLLFPEPEMMNTTELEADAPTVIQFEYEDGPHNCESVAVDTERNEILLVSKSKSGSSDVTGVYCIPLTLNKGTTTATARRIANLEIIMATAMDISPDGRRMAILSPDGAFCVDRRENETWGDALKSKPRIVPLPKRRNGETVCFGRDRNELLLHSESVGQPLWSVTISDIAAGSLSTSP
ncbi:MAG TPA: hypothetical protein PL033_07500 [Candidatus Brocadiia bacterium]|nr:hypothetical protein [Candidatus Brocadiia bacterium]